MKTHSTIQYFVEQSAKTGNYLFVKLKMIAVSNADTTNFSCRAFDYCRSFVCAIFFIPKKITGSIADFTKIT